MYENAALAYHRQALSQVLLLYATTLTFLILLRLEEGRKISSEIEGHEGPVYALYAYQAPDDSGTCLVTGGGDGKVKTWDAEVTPTTPTVRDAEVLLTICLPITLPSTPRRIKYPLPPASPNSGPICQGMMVISPQQNAGRVPIPNNTFFGNLSTIIFCSSGTRFGPVAIFDISPN